LNMENKSGGRGIWYISAAHTQEDLEKCILAAKQTLAEMRD